MNNISSINLDILPFLSSCDSTRAGMAAKQLNQSLIYKDCEIPYIISNKYRNLVNSSSRSIEIAVDNGKVLIQNDEIIVYYYTTLDKIKIKHIPQYKQTSGIYTSKLRYHLNTNDKFKTGDIIYSYNDFREGVPSFGYNVMTGYFNFFGYNHEDALVVSESVANKAKSELREVIYIPIYNETVLQPLYDSELIYLPDVGDKIKNDILCVQIRPKKRINSSNQNIKTKLAFLKKIAIPDLINLSNSKIMTSYELQYTKSKIPNATVNGIKIHKLNKNINLIDPKLKEMLQKIYETYCEEYIYKTFTDIKTECGQDLAIQVAKEYLVYQNDMISSNMTNLKNAIYVLEIELVKESKSILGDKFCNRFAGKGVLSLILPDELRPITCITNIPLDLVFNTFGVFSRMNISQIIECLISKNIQNIESKILEDPNSLISELTKLNDDIIYNLNDFEYYNDTKQLIGNLKKDENLQDEFLSQVSENNLFIEAPQFKEINIKNLLKHSIAPREDILIPKETLIYLKDKLKLDLGFTINGDVKLKNIFCGPTYIMKLNKLADKIINARALGNYKKLTSQPLQGRSVESGKSQKVGSMEIESIIANGCPKALNELLTVKSDYLDMKHDFFKQIIETCQYHIPPIDESNQGGTKRTINTLIKFLED